MVVVLAVFGGEEVESVLPEGVVLDVESVRAAVVVSDEVDAVVVADVESLRALLVVLVEPSLLVVVVVVVADEVVDAVESVRTVVVETVETGVQRQVRQPETTSDITGTPLAL